MKIASGILSICAGAIVSAAFLHQTADLHKQDCIRFQAAIESASPSPLIERDKRLGLDPNIQRLMRAGPGCTDLDETDLANAFLGGALVAFACYVFSLLFGKFEHWASKR